MAHLRGAPPRQTRALWKSRNEREHAITTSYSVSSIVDVGSGDWSYMKDVNIASYNGYDVSSIIVDNTTALYGSNINNPTSTGTDDDGKFVAFHLSKINQMYESADMMICKDVLLHLPLDAAQHIVDQQSKFKVSIFVNDATMDSSNDDILRAGSYRSLDVEKPPFNIKCNHVLNLHPTLKGYGGQKRTCVVFNEEMTNTKWRSTCIIEIEEYIKTNGLLALARQNNINNKHRIDNDVLEKKN
jgi:hypothetical protein